MKITSVKDAAEVRDGLFQSQHVANAHHLIYAYSVIDVSGMGITGHSDNYNCKPVIWLIFWISIE